MAKDQDETMQDANGANGAVEKHDGINGDGSKKDVKDKGQAKKKNAEKVELSEEDLELKANLEMIVERISDSDPAVQSSALDNMSRLPPYMNLLQRCGLPVYCCCTV